MVKIYLCEACRTDNHAKCELGYSVPAGQYGGSRCWCGCNGNPKWNDPEEFHKELSKQIKLLDEFEKKSMKLIKKSKKKAK